jgi:preprotein translocase SecE subunit
VARDRKRAKQRRDRRDRRGGASPSSVPNDPAPGEGNGRGDDDTLQAPPPLEHSSAEVDIAEAQVALGRPDAEVAPDAEQAYEEDGAGTRGGAEVATPQRSGGEGNRVVAFMRGSWRELQRVQWPDRRQVFQATGVVLGFVIIAGAFLGLADLVAGKLVDAIL